MVGSGFYLSPSALAPYGILAIVSWIAMGAGAICLGLTFARLSRLTPATGGPYAYTRMGFGDFAGFLVAWGYWISIWASLPAIAVAFTGSLFEIVPVLQGNRPLAVIVTLGVMWLVVLTNLRGVKEAGVVAEITTYSKMVPFVAISIFGLLFIRQENLSEFNPSGQSLLASAATLAPLTMFAYLGLESATVPAGDVQDPERTIPRSTILGVSIAALLYVLGTTVVLGVVPREELVKSAAPFADAARIMWGSWAAGIVGIAVMLSSLGALNGWTLLMGQVPMAAAHDRLFPALFGRVSSRGVPAVGIMLSAVLATALVLIQAAGSVGVRRVLQPGRQSGDHDGRGSLRVLRVVGRTRGGTRTGNGRVPRVTPVEESRSCLLSSRSTAAARRPVLYGFLLLMLGIPVYVWQRRAQAQGQ